MRISEVIDPRLNQEPPISPSSPSKLRSGIARQDQSLLALLYQALTRDGRVIAPGIIGSDFEQSEERPEEDDDRLSGNVNRVSGIVG